jgi:phosphohistidine phosphatase
VELYLMQHGEAVAAEIDPQRPLSPQGVRSVRDVAGRAAASGVQIDRIVHSGKARAAQSAQILADALACTDVSEVVGLAPNDSVEDAASRLIGTEADASVAVVGHLPFLDRLAGLLVAADPQVHVVAFRNGGLVHLVPTSQGRTGDGDAGTAAPLAGRFAVSWGLVPDPAAP